MNAPSLLTAAPAACCEDEKWDLIPDWPHHEASSCGRVRMLDHLGADGRLRLGGILPQFADKRPGKGYLYVMLRDGARHRKAAVAVLVLEAHRGLRPGPGYEACHNHGVRTDNHLSEIRWDTKKANRADRELHRLGSRTWAAPEGTPGVLITLAEAITADWLPPTWSDPGKQFSVAKCKAAKAGNSVPATRARDGHVILYDSAELAAFIRSVTSHVTENRANQGVSPVTVSPLPDFPRWRRPLTRVTASVTRQKEDDTGRSPSILTLRPFFPSLKPSSPTVRNQPSRQES